MTDPTTTDGRRQAVVPRATYRLQLHADFDFAAATAVLPYLRRLGISHVYCSPIWRARPGSRHGYDVVEPGAVNPELGGEAGFRAFAMAANAEGLGLLLDMVPNHMGVFGADNPWWLDVLENGQASRYAGHFDIDWSPPNRALRGKLLVPVLGEAYGQVLERGELKLGIAGGRLALHYHQHLFPLDPRSYAQVLQHAVEALPPGAAARKPLQQLSKQCAALATHDEADVQRRAERQQAVPGLMIAFADLLQDAAVRAAIEEVLAGLNDAPTKDALDALHDRQAYRLASWRVAADEINYRRFFDVNELAAIRVEDDAVFEATHGRALDFCAEGLADGLRIDHPDGLLDPAAYFAKLQAGYAARVGGGVDAAARPLYVVAEKIAASHEDVPADWALHGTTGYRFANVLNGLFVERRHAARLERLWREHSGSDEGFDELAREAKLAVARTALASDLTLLAQALHRVGQAHRSTRDHGFHTLREALAEVAASMPVYRTYVVDRPSAQDRRFIDWAVADARKRSRIDDEGVFEFVRRCLLLDPPPGLGGPKTAALLARFVQRFQQFCAPVAAKGVEDTAFYRYHRLVSLNEVGGEPDVFGLSAAAFHGASADRARRWPHTMLASSTHDNKRSEDVRQRINVLSEQPAAWRLALRRWRAGTRALRSEVDGRPAPSASDDFLLYQTLVGSLPAELDDAALAAYRERIHAYMLKAVREAKQHTRWTRPNPAYEDALARFIDGVLGRLQPNPLLGELRARAAELAWFGALNSLSATVLKLAAPGVPDLYQGSELMPLLLVDPDNRSPVDYALRQDLLQGFEQATAGQGGPFGERLAALAVAPDDGRLKLWCAWRLLQLRAQRPALFRDGGYQPLRVTGARRGHAIAFARCHADATLVVVAGRKFAQAFAPRAWPAGAAAWADTGIAWPIAMARRLGAGVQATELLSGRTLALEAGGLALGDAFAELPVAALLLSHAAG